MEMCGVQIKINEIPERRVMRRKGHAERAAEMELRRKKKAHREAIVVMTIFGCACGFFYWALWTACNSLGG